MNDGIELGEHDDDPGEPIGSCDECGVDIYADEDDGSGLCDQCGWWRDQC